MLKRDEIANSNSCLNRARDDEMLFVLLGRDAAAPVAIRARIAERVRLGKNQLNDQQIQDAEKCAAWLSPATSLSLVDTIAAAEALINQIVAVSGEIREVLECKHCRRLIGRRYIPFGHGQGLTVNSCLCYLTQRNCPTEIVLGLDP